MKVNYFFIVLFLFLFNVQCDTIIQKIFSKFIDKSPTELFKLFIHLYKKDYTFDSENGLKRFTIFQQNLNLIQKTNAENLSYTLGINQFADLTKDEFIAQYLTNPEVLKKQMESLFDESDSLTSNLNVAARSKVDWSYLHLPARDQKNCGSCWAFTTAGVVEANWWKSNSSSAKISLSTQQLVDCDRSNNGCDGGWYDGSFTYTKTTGLVIDSAYPYTARVGACNIPSSSTKYKIDSYQKCTRCTTDQWYTLLAQGSIAIAMDASDFQLYKGGIIKFSGCGQINHAVIGVGWDSDSQGDFITIRNSWGPNWGENGLMRVRVNEADQTCSATSYAYLPIIGSNPPPPPPPPPSNCFTPTTAWQVNSLWKLPSTFKGKVSFKATGVNFNIGTFATASSVSNGYIINVAGRSGSFSNATTVTSNNNSNGVCMFMLNINPALEYHYVITFSSTNGISISINNVEVNCMNTTFASVSNWIGFSSQSSGLVKICSLAVSS